MNINAYPLGQVGYLFEQAKARLLIDPYLGDAVADRFGENLRRRYVSTLSGDQLTGLDGVLLTHAHLDHTDPDSLRQVLAASPAVPFYAPYECMPVLREVGIPESQCHLVDAGSRFACGTSFEVEAIPAAHTDLEKDEAGRCRYLGFYIKTPEKAIYHAGDTVPHDEILTALEGKPVDYAFLPVNECNFFKAKAGIVGNMSTREAFIFAENIQARCLVPTHWDLFQPNSVYPWEIQALHTALKPNFELRLMPCGAAYRL